MISNPTIIGIAIATAGTLTTQPAYIYIYIRTYINCRYKGNINASHIVLDLISPYFRVTLVLRQCFFGCCLVEQRKEYHCSYLLQH